MHNDAVMKNMAPVPRRIALRVISGYRTISQGATLLLAGMAPIWLLAKERANVWKRQQREDVTATPPYIKRETQAALLQGWQGEWSAYPKGRWIHTLIRIFKNGRLEITEVSITGLRRHSVDMGASVPNCSSIKSEAIQPARTVALDRMTPNTRSSAAQSTRSSGTVLQHSIGVPFEPETVVEIMLRRPESWDKITCYFRHVITKKTEKEAEIQRMTNHGPSD